MKNKTELISAYLNIAALQRTLDDAALKMLQAKVVLHEEIIGFMLQNNAKAFDLGNGTALKLAEYKSEPPLGCKEDPLFETVKKALIEWPTNKLPTNYREALV